MVVDVVEGVVEDAVDAAFVVDNSVDVIDISLSRFTNLRLTKLTISSCLIFGSVGKEETRKIWNKSTIEIDGVAIILISALFTLNSV